MGWVSNLKIGKKLILGFGILVEQFKINVNENGADTEKHQQHTGLRPMQAR